MRYLALVMLFAWSASGAVPPANTAKKLLVFGDYNPAGDGGHPSAMGGIFGVRAPANWTYYFSGHNFAGDSTPCMDWTNALDNSTIPFDIPLINLALASNINFIVFYAPNGAWSFAQATNPAVGPSGGVDQVLLNAIRYATESGINVFLPHCCNALQFYDYAPFKSPGSPIAVGGGYPDTTTATNTFGPQLEFVDSLDSSAGGIAESFANQAAASRFAHVLNDHPTYNNYDARAYCHQAGTATWSTNIGYGFIQVTNRGNNPAVTAATVSSLNPHPPLEIFAIKVGGILRLYWRNFYQTGWQSTVVKFNGVTVYEGSGGSVIWPGTVNIFGMDYPFSNVSNGIEVEYPKTRGTFTFYTKVGGVLSSDTGYSQITTGGVAVALSGRLGLSGRIVVGP